MAGQENRVEVEIYGERYILKGDATEEHMERLARFVDEQMRQVSRRNPRLPLYKLAVLTALNIADELFKLMEKDRDGEVEERKEDTPSF